MNNLQQYHKFAQILECFYYWYR